MSAADNFGIFPADLASQPSETNIIINNNNSENSCLPLIMYYMPIFVLCSSALHRRSPRQCQAFVFLTCCLACPMLNHLCMLRTTRIR